MMHSLRRRQHCAAAMNVRASWRRTVAIGKCRASPRPFEITSARWSGRRHCRTRVVDEIGAIHRGAEIFPMVQERHHTTLRRWP